MNNLSVRIVTVLAVFIMLFSSAAYGGRVGRAAHTSSDSLSAQLGVRFDSLLPESPQPGQTFQAMVLDPGKLNTLGLQGAKRGDRLTFMVLRGDGKFQVQYKGKVHMMQMDDKGVVKPMAPANIPPAVSSPSSQKMNTKGIESPAMEKK